MELLSRIIAPVDGSATSDRALPVAAALATMTGAEMTLVTVAVHPSHVDTAERVLRRAAFTVGRPVSYEVLVGQPVGQVLLAYVHSLPGAMVVMSTHARTAVGELLLGSVADEMARRGSAPVVLVGPHSELPARGTRYSELIACVDSGNDAERVLPVVTTLSANAGMRPWIFEVVSEAGLPSGSPEGDVLETNYVRTIGTELRRAGVEAEWDVGHDNDVANGIVTFARSRVAPLIALAPHGREPMERLAAASVTARVARTAQCPVIVVGPAFATAAVRHLRERRPA